MSSPPPSIRDFPTFKAELAEALMFVDAHIARYPDHEAFVFVREQLLAVRNYTADGRCPTIEELSRMTFGQIAAHDLDDHPELADALSRVSEYLRVWPRGERAPTWHDGRPSC